MAARFILLSGVLLMAAWKSHAQQLPQFSYFTFNYINYNPAVTGFASCFEMRVGYREQWVGFEGAPKSAFALAHGKFGVKRNRFHGIGGYVENDSFGPFSYTGLQLNYAFHFRLAGVYTLATGLSVGFSQNRVDFGRMTLEDQINDPILTSSINEFVFPRINMGLWLYKSDRFYGFSMRQVVQNTIGDLEPQTLRTHLTLAHGRSVNMSKDLTFKPAVLLNYVGKSRASLEAQGVFEFKETVAAGLGMRSGNGVSGLVKLHLLRYLTLAYAYDLTLSKMRFDSNGTHEVMLGFRACSLKDDRHVPCAAYD
jgi:type IX secretion system PorP/SprF family membrane protein